MGLSRFAFLIAPFQTVSTLPMGWASRANPRSFDGCKSESAVFLARLDRFCRFFSTRQQYEEFLATAGVTDAERAILEARLPDHLKAQGTV